MKEKKPHISRHDRIANIIRRDIQSLARDTRLDSMRKLARRYDVSLNTLRMALVLLQSEGRIELRHGSGCYVKAPDETNRHIAILTEMDILTPGVSLLYLRGIQHLRLFLEANKVAARLYIGHTAPQDNNAGALTCPEFFEEAAHDRIRGVAAIGTLPLAAWSAPLRKRGIPIVGMGAPDNHFDAVVNPDVGGFVRTAVRCLAERGCKRPALLGWGVPLDYARETDRLNVFQDAIHACGMEYHPEWIRKDFHPLDAGAGWSNFREIWIAHREKPDSLIVFDDILFQEVSMAIQHAGISAPAELAVIVAANKGLKLATPFAFWRWDVDPEEFARQMGSALLALVSRQEPGSRNIIIPYRLAESTPAAATAPAAQSTLRIMKGSPA